MRPLNTNMTNGSWCPSLKINKDSHIIKKPSSSSTTSSSNSSSVSHSPSPPPLNPPKPQQRHPVIIYTHSPKVIHTQPKDFMALVQKLTGMSQKDDKKTANITHDNNSNINNNNNNNNNINNKSSNVNNCQDPRKVESRPNCAKIEESESLSEITTNEDLCSNGYGRDQPTNYFMGNNAGINGSSNNNSHNHNELLCCSSGTDQTYDFIDFNVPLN